MSEDNLHYISVDSIQPNAWNPQDMDDRTFNRLVDEIGEVGFISPITVVDMGDGSYRILGGEHRWKAARTLGIPEIPALVVPLEDWDEDQQKFVTVRLNVLSGRLDAERFIGLYTEMTDKYGTDAVQDLFAFTDDKAFQKLVGSVRDTVKDTLPKHLQKEFDAAAKEARTVEDLDKIIRDLFNKYGDTVTNSFMVFTFGKYEHIYVAMDAAMNKQVRKLMDLAVLEDRDINEYLIAAVKQAAGDAGKRLAELNAAGKREDAVDF